MVLSPVAYAELYAHPEAAPDLVEAFIQQIRISVEWNLDREVWVPAAERFATYASRRRASGVSVAKQFLADFLIGAHTLIQADALITFDRKRYLSSFPDLQIVPLGIS